MDFLIGAFKNFRDANACAVYKLIVLNVGRKNRMPSSVCTPIGLSFRISVD